MPPSNEDTNDVWMIYHANLQTIICGLSELAVHKHQALMNFSVDLELCVLPSGVTAIRQAIVQTYYIITLIFWVDGQAAERHGPFWVIIRLNGWVYVAGHMALSYYLTSASTCN